MVKKIVLTVIGVVVGVLAIAAIGVFMFVQSILPEKEEYIAYGKDERIQVIDQQLQGIDIAAIRAKADLIMEKPVADIQQSVTAGDLSYEELTAFYLDRIKTYDAAAKGINAVAEVNKDAIAQAKLRDEERKAPSAQGSQQSEMFGIPVLLKDNINTKNMVTSAGMYALKDFTPATNAPLVDRLEANGAIILGKANLSEMANFMDTKMPSGYSSRSGQTHNPFNPIETSPQGSSSGSGAAVAANLSAVAIGTETTGSIIAPAAIHSTVGMKPTKDLISAKGVIPLASTMDTVGPMAKNVKDMVALFNAAVDDPAKALPTDLDANALKGKKIGVSGAEGDNTLADMLQTAGAQVVRVKLDDKGLDNGFIIDQDFRADLNAYFKEFNAPVKSLEELIAFNNEDKGRRAKYGQRLIEAANEVTTPDRAKVETIVKDAQSRMKKLMEEHGLDAIVFFDNEGVLPPAIAGYPELTVPAGKNEDGEPKGATFIALGGQDATLANLAYSFEQSTKARLIPEKYKEIVSK
ncbi:MAG: amidase family protein [Actinomycetaceae bacterium]|nr:amidase family protein [Actinomycetaceae bacterium]